MAYDSRLTAQDIPSSALPDVVDAGADVLPAGAGAELAMLSTSVDRGENEVIVAPIEVQPGKKRRGRPPRNPPLAAAAAAVAGYGVAATMAESKRRKKVAKEEKEDEDVCFICFDGGSLVLCDHRDCPKAYHPACVKRDESYFIPSVRWECGWHLCNLCQRNAVFLCYTCPYSLCKGCAKQAEIFCVRGNKGFCKTCMSTIMLIEKIPQEDNELPQVDFDDATCWEYLFKVYWILLKNKEALIMDELLRASNPWKASAERKTHRDTYFSNSAHLTANISKKRKTRKPQPPLIMDSQKIVKSGSNKVPGLPGRPDWASKELLEFVAYMKNGDVSSLPEFDVHALLLDYIKNNNLYDPRQKCQIICDKRLESLFGKERVGHFEMLKLLEYHFKEESSSNGVIPGAGPSGLVEEGTTVDIQTSCRNTRQQSRINGDEGDRRVDPKAYAAIDAHNINLIYLKRGLLETMTVDAEKFHDKVVGSVVRIKLSNNDQKQDMHRLVRIIGSSKATQPYKIGDKMENFMLKILNLNKIEDVRIDAISDQEFSEDECRRLRQSIKLGLVERMTVGEIQEKATVLQAVRVGDRVETEIRRLNHLRDRASEMGRQKELRELVEKIELLRTPEECQRRIDRVLEVHADPRMDPSCGSDDESGESDMKRRDVALTPRYSKSMESISPCRVGDKSKVDRARTLKAVPVNGERKRKYSKKFHSGEIEGTSGSLEPPQKTERPDVASRVLERDSRTDSSVISQCNSDPSKAALKEMMGVSDVSELEKIWCYQDPLGKVQGPFFMLQLRKWDSCDFFPNDLRVWKMNETCDQSVLLKDALKKPQSSEPHFVQRSCLQSHDGKVNSIGVMNSNSVTSWVSDQTNEECSKSNMTDTACTLEQTVNGYSSQFLKAQLIDSLFNIEEPGSDSTAERSPETMHVIPKSEPSRPSNCVPMSANVDVASLAVNNGSPCPNVGKPDSESILDIASERISATDLLGSMPVSNHTKDLHADGRLHDKSDAWKDFNVSCGTEAVAIKFSDLPVSLPKTQIKDSNDHDNTVAGGTNVSFLPSAAPKVMNDHMTSHEAENRHSISLDVPQGNSGSIVSCGMDNSLLPRTTSNKEVKANAVDVSGTPWISNSGGITVSDLPNISPNPETDGFKTSLAESNGFPTPNIPGQDSGISWSDMTMTGGMGFSINASTPLKLEIDASVSVAVENNHCPQHVEGQEFNMSWTNPSSIGAEIDLLDIGNDWDWQPIEFSTLGDDSVSDLLSEVEAMEALRGMSSPVAADDSIGSLGDDCFNPLGGLNLNLDLGKNDAAFSASFSIDVSDIPGTSGILSTLGPAVETMSIPVTASLPPQTPVPDLNVVSQAPTPLSLTSSPLASPPLPTPASPTPTPAVSKLPFPPPAAFNFPSSLPPAPTAAKTHPPSLQQTPLPPPAALKLPSQPTAARPQSPPLQQSPLLPPTALKLESPLLSSPELPPAPTAAKPHSPPPQQSPLPPPTALKLQPPPLSSPPLAPAPTAAKPHSPPPQQSPLPPPAALKLPSPTLSSPQLPLATAAENPHSPPPQQSPLPLPTALKLPSPPFSSPPLLPAPTAAKPHSPPPQQSPLPPPAALQLPSPTLSSPQLPPATAAEKPHSPPLQQSLLPQPAALKLSPSPLSLPQRPRTRTAAKLQSLPLQQSPLPSSGAFKLPSSPISPPQVPPAIKVAKQHSASPQPPKLPPAPKVAKQHSPSPQPPPPAEKSPSPQPPILRPRSSSNPKVGRVEPTSIPAQQGVKRTAASVEFSWKQGSETTTSGKFSGTGSILGSPNINRTTSGQVTTPGVWANTPQGTPMVTSPRYNHSVGRQAGPKDLGHQYNNVTDSGFGKSRPASWNKQSSFGGRGGGPLRPGPPHRSQQRVCKFHESGYCRHGESCKYLHP